MDINENIARAADLQRDATKAKFEFLDTDIDTALTFANIALNAGDDFEKKNRNTINARNGYDTVASFLARMSQSEVSSPAVADLRTKLAGLKVALEQLGERFTE